MLKDIAEDTNHRDTPAAIVAIYDDYNIPIKTCRCDREEIVS